MNLTHITMATVKQGDVEVWIGSFEVRETWMSKRVMKDKWVTFKRQGLGSYQFNYEYPLKSGTRAQDMVTSKRVNQLPVLLGTRV
jgi:hypothetical protein